MDKPLQTNHLVLTESDIKSRIIIVGDIHGCYDEYKELLEKCSYNRISDTLILTGDLVCKGPKSAEVVKDICQNNILSVKGNIDVKALIHYKKLKDTQGNWGEHEWFKQLTEQEINYLQRLPLTISIPHLNIIIVHAGILPNIPLENQKSYNLMNMRNIDEADGVLKVYSSTKKGIAWIQKWTGPQHIYFGHDARRNLQKSEYATGLDSGCCYGRELTACVLTPALFEKEFVQVKAKVAYMPIKE